MPKCVAHLSDDDIPMLSQTNDTFVQRRTLTNLFVVDKAYSTFHHLLDKCNIPMRRNDRFNSRTTDGMKISIMQVQSILYLSLYVGMGLLVGSVGPMMPSLYANLDIYSSKKRYSVI